MKTTTNLGVSQTSNTNISGSARPGACNEAGQSGLRLLEVSADYYESFLALTDDDMEILVRAVLTAQAGEARRLIRAESFVAAASARLTQLIVKTLSSIAVNHARFNYFAQLELLKPVGPEPKRELDAALSEKIGKACPIITWAVRDFIQAHIDNNKPMSPVRRRVSPLREPNRTS